VPDKVLHIVELHSAEDPHGELIVFKHLPPPAGHILDKQSVLNPHISLDAPVVHLPETLLHIVEAHSVEDPHTAPMALKHVPPPAGHTPEKQSRVDWHLSPNAPVAQVNELVSHIEAHSAEDPHCIPMAFKHVPPPAGQVSDRQSRSVPQLSSKAPVAHLLETLLHMVEPHSVEDPHVSPIALKHIPLPSGHIPDTQSELAIHLSPKAPAAQVCEVGSHIEAHSAEVPHIVPMAFKQFPLEEHIFDKQSKLTPHLSLKAPVVHLDERVLQIVESHSTEDPHETPLGFKHVPLAGHLFDRQSRLVLHGSPESPVVQVLERVLHRVVPHSAEDPHGSPMAFRQFEPLAGHILDKQSISDPHLLLKAPVVQVLERVLHIVDVHSAEDPHEMPLGFKHVPLEGHTCARQSEATLQVSPKNPTEHLFELLEQIVETHWLPAVQPSSNAPRHKPPRHKLVLQSVGILQRSLMAPVEHRLL
jgi:hypothetical protein